MNIKTILALRIILFVIIIAMSPYSPGKTLSPGTTNILVSSEEGLGGPLDRIDIISQSIGAKWNLVGPLQGEYTCPSSYLPYCPQLPGSFSGIQRDLINSTVRIKTAASSCAVDIDSPTSCDPAILPIANVESSARVKLVKRFTIDESDSDEKVTLASNIYLKLSYVGRMSLLSLGSIGANANFAVSAMVWDVTSNKQVELKPLMSQSVDIGLSDFKFKLIGGTLPIIYSIPESELAEESPRVAFSINLERGKTYEVQVFIAVKSSSGNGIGAFSYANFKDPVFGSDGGDGLITINELTVDVGSDPLELLYQLSERVRTLEEQLTNWQDKSSEKYEMLKKEINDQQASYDSHSHECHLTKLKSFNKQKPFDIKCSKPKH